MLGVNNSLKGLMVDRNADSYNKIITQWSENRNKSLLNKCVVDFAAKIKPNGKVLDIGCGTGYPITKYLSEQGFHVTGIDISENMIEEALRLGLPNSEFYLCDFFDYQPTRKFDGVIAFDSFFHFPKLRQTEIYRRVSDWMNIGAYLLFTHGKYDSELESKMYGEVFYYSSLNIDDVYRLLSESGFTIEMIIEDYKEVTSGERDLLVLAKKVREQQQHLPFLTSAAARHNA